MASFIRDPWSKALKGFRPYGKRSDQLVGPIFMDLTTTADRAGRMTGISRAEISLARSLREMLGDRIRFTIYSRGQFFEYTESSFDQYALNRFNFLLGSARLRLAPLDLDQEGGLFLVAGSGWMQNLQYSLAVSRFASANRLAVGLVVFDLIPVLFPFWHEAGYAEKFRQSLLQILRVTAVAFCISENTASDLRRFCLDHRIVEPAYRVFRLGDNIRSTENEVEAGPGNAGPAEDYILAVGAIHKRKNYEILFSALKILDEQGFVPPKLLIAGGWMPPGREIARIALEDDFLQTRVEVRADIDDDQLAELYSNSLFTLYPSLYEGWGLPVCESFQSHKICLASDAASIPEILPHYEHYLPPLDPNAWASRIRHFSANNQARSAGEAWIAANYTAWSWFDSAVQLLSHWKAVSGNENEGRQSAHGETWPLIDRCAEPIFNGGWGVETGWGRWSDATLSSAQIPLPQHLRACRDLVLQMELRSPVAQRIGISVNRAKSVQAYISPKPAITLVELDNHPVDGLYISVQFECEQLVVDASLSKAPIGLGLGWTRLVSGEELRRNAKLTGSAHDRRLLAGRDPTTLWRPDFPEVRTGDEITLLPNEEMVLSMNLAIPGLEGDTANCMVLLNNTLSTSFTHRCGGNRMVRTKIGKKQVKEAGGIHVEVIALDTNRRSTLFPVRILEYEIDSTQLLIPPAGESVVRPILYVNHTVKLGNQEESESLDYLAFGWKSLEQYGVQSAGSYCVLEFYIDKPLEKWRLVLNMKCRCAGASRNVEVTANGTPLDSLQVTNAGLQRYSFDSSMPIDAVLRLELKVESDDPADGLTLRHFALIQVD